MNFVSQILHIIASKVCIEMIVSVLAHLTSDASPHPRGTIERMFACDVSCGSIV
jgi:hypothetical protein